MVPFQIFKSNFLCPVSLLKAAKKLEHHVDVLERFLHLSIKPPATVAEISTAERAIREKKVLL